MTAHFDLMGTRLPDLDSEAHAVASSLRRVVFTHDHRFRATAQQWQRDGRQFAGLAFGPAEGASIGQYVPERPMVQLEADQSEGGEEDPSVS